MIMFCSVGFVGSGGVAVGGVGRVRVLRSMRVRA